MNVGIVTAWSECGAGYVSRAYDAALSRNHRVFVLARDRRDVPESALWGGRAVTRVKPHTSLTGVRRRDLQSWIRRNALNCVIFNEQRHWAAVADARSEGVLVGAYVDYYTADTVRLFGLYDFLVCNTRRHASVFAWHPGSRYVPWGTDVALFSPRARPARPVTFFHSAGWVGFNDRKGTGATLRAFRRVRGDVRLVVHVQRAVSELPSEMQECIRGDPRIEVRTGTVAPPGLYHLGDVYVYPGRLDGIGLSVPEAMASGLACIVPNEGPWTEFVTPESGALLQIARRVARSDGYFWPEVEVDDDALVAAMQRFADDPGLSFAAGRASRARAVGELDWARNAAALDDVLAGAARRAVSPVEMARARSRDRIDNPTAAQQWLAATRRLIGAFLPYG
jgi:glycosyltransferase involved in cell wall biosynthesis